MKNVLRFTGFVLVAGLLTVSCSKEKRIERKLTRKSGKWNIEKYENEFYENGIMQEQYVMTNAGNFVFDDDGTVTETYIESGSTYTYAGTWSNTEDKLTIIEDGDAIVWTIKEFDKHEMELEYVDQYTSGGVTYRDVYTIELEKDK